jgi:phosphotransferase system HPr (HPr) family protein
MSGPASEDLPVIRGELRLVNRHGLHARPISQIVRMVSATGVRVRITGPDGTVADASSAFSMMTLAAPQGAVLAVEVCGNGAQALWARLAELVGGGFGED